MTAPARRPRAEGGADVKTKNVWVYLASYKGASPEPLSAISRTNAEVFRAADKRNGYAVGPIVRIAVPVPGGDNHV